MKKTTKREAALTRDRPGRDITWSLRGRTYVPVTPAESGSPGVLDEDRVDSKTDEGGPDQP